MGMTTAKPFTRLLRGCMLMLLASLAGTAQAQPRLMEEGRNFEAIAPPVATEAAADIIEVADVFWYGCPVCQEFEPMMTYWGSQIRGDLVMRRMPAIWNAVMKTHARLYFTAQQLQLADTAHPAAFEHIHAKQQALSTEAEAQAFFAELGVAADDFQRTWNSAEVLAALDKAEQATTAAGIDRLPALIVNGRYRVTRSESAPELPDMVITINQLIRSERDQRRID